MPPKRKAGATTAAAKKQAKATEHSETANGSGVEENNSTETGHEVGEEVAKKAEPAPTRAGRPKRGGGPAPVYTESQGPPEKISKVEKKPKEKPEKKSRATKKKEEVEEDNDNEEEEAVDNNDSEEPAKTSKLDKKTKEKPEKKARGAVKKKEELDEDNDHEDEESTSNTKQKTDKKGKAEKINEKPKKGAKKAAETAKAKQDTEKEKKAPGKPSRKVKNKDEDEENGKDEDSKEKNEKIPTNPTATKWDDINFNCTKKNINGETFNLKISCWNIGGLKSWVKKDCMKFLEYEDPDILCLQETKCSEEKLPDEIKDITDYKQYWCSSDKEGYAGVGLLTKKEPKNVTYGINEPDQDGDGRCITAEYDDYYIVCVYVPNAGRKLITLPKRLEWNEAFKTYINKLNKKKPVIICGDMNVSHNEIDLARPKSNTKNAGFTEEERDGMTDFLGEGYVDTFRDLYPDKTDMYTFWTYMGNARSKNVGWRLDYFILSERIKDNVCDNVIRSEVLGSDHCPITLFINL